MEDKKEGVKKILIVDDDKFLLDMYTIKLKEKGFDVTPTRESTDVLNRLRGGETPDVMLLDIVMPAMDGFELLAAIKKENLAPHAKIIILSNLGLPSDIERGRELGANGYVVKASSTPSMVVERVIATLNGEELFQKVD
ncbi:MAG: Response regulator receiver protein [Parcubacteria group bacterium GW2011_GWA1_47_8]|nr:MAG: Response regulator receiver protein [Parcubacteria group bacterium GW2011_GWA1_47_8]KKW07749.1 MAG: Response regulator receiver protein [Parcubacteria group bacterium GW2011_GWA2_49_16]